MRTYWDFENCKIEAKKYLTRTEFKTESKGAYDFARKYKYLDEVCKHMIEKKKPENFWCFENCQIEAKKYLNRTEFKTKSKSAYNKCLKEKWIEGVCSHMITLIKPKNYWINKENCHKEALKYTSRTVFSKKSIHCYITSMNNKWLDEICSHMIRIGNKSKRCIYAGIFEDNSIYIGLTSDFNRRISEHLTGINKYSKNKKSSAIYKHIEKTKLIPKFILLHDYTDIDNAILLEQKEVELYKNINFNILNICKCGSIGGFKKFE